jgi:SAM-dependent methyltransferase
MPVPHDPRLHHAPDHDDPTEFWDHRYADKPQIWSGRVNPTLAALVNGFAPARALDLGCGEGGDSLWLAGQGWEVVAVDISAVAIERGRAAAKASGIDADRIRWVAADLATWTPPAEYELVTACFLQSPVTLDRVRILRTAADRIVPGGHLLVVSHATPPPWASGLTGHEHELLTPQQELAALALPATDWQEVVVGTRQRTATGPDGQTGVLDDAVVLLRRN